METQTTIGTINAPKWKRAEAYTRLTPELREQFIAYFMAKYPITKKITLRRRYDQYCARVKYRAENPNRTFCVWAFTYETLVSTMLFWYTKREIPMANHR